MPTEQPALVTQKCPYCGGTVVVLKEGVRDENEVPLPQKDGPTVFGVHPTFMGPGDPTIIMTNPCVMYDPPPPVQEFHDDGVTLVDSNIPPRYRDEAMCSN